MALFLLLIGLGFWFVSYESPLFGVKGLLQEMPYKCTGIIIFLIAGALYLARLGINL